MDTSSTSRSRTTAASTKLYRAKELSTRGIFFRKAPYALDQLPKDIRAPLRLCSHLDIETTFEDILVQQPFEQTNEIVTDARRIVAEVELCLEDSGDEDVWTQGLWPKVYEKMRFDRDLCLSANSLWDAQINTTSFKVAGLTSPKPDIAYGFRVPLTGSEQGRLLSSDVLGALEDHPSLNLHPRPSPQNKSIFAYPGYIHEIKPSSGTPEYVENQIAKSLAFAMDQQRELQAAVSEIDASAENKIFLPIIGATSIGEKMTIFYTVSGDNDGIVSLGSVVRFATHTDQARIPNIFKDIIQYDTLDLSHPRHACAAVLFTHALAHWLKTTYKARLLELLNFVHGHYLKLRLSRQDMRNQFITSNQSA